MWEQLYRTKFESVRCQARRYKAGVVAFDPVHGAVIGACLPPRAASEMSRVGASLIRSPALFSTMCSFYNTVCEASHDGTECKAVQYWKQATSSRWGENGASVSLPRKHRRPRVSLHALRSLISRRFSLDSTPRTALRESILCEYCTVLCPQPCAAERRPHALHIKGQR